MVMPNNDDFFLSQLIITVFAFSVVLLSLEAPKSGQLVKSVDLPGKAVDLLRRLSVCFQ
jgi:hypothetical protein